MDAFETVVASILQRQGYWTLTSVKVELTKAEKVKIGRHSSPRWELDVVAYRGKGNEVLAVECKSFLDSPGVECSAFDGSNVVGIFRFVTKNRPKTECFWLACQSSLATSMCSL